MKRRNNWGIDLTPLLDILFILLFLVIMRSVQYVGTKVEEAERVAVEAQERVSEAEEKLEQAWQQESEARRQAGEALQEAEEARSRAAQAEAKIGEYGALLNGSVSARIRIGQEDGLRVLSFSSGNNEGRWVLTPELTGCEQFLKDNIQNLLRTAGGEEPAPAFLIFTYDPERIYNIEYNMIYNVLTQLQQSNENVYLQFREESE